MATGSLDFNLSLRVDDKSLEGTRLRATVTMFIVSSALDKVAASRTLQ